MKLDNYILDTSKKIVICYFSAISFISLNCENTGPFKKNPHNWENSGFFFLLMATGLKCASSNEKLISVRTTYCNQ